MSAAKPSQPKVENVLRAMIACGIQPGIIRVDADGSFTVEAVSATVPAVADNAGDKDLSDDEPPTWENSKDET